MLVVMLIRMTHWDLPLLKVGSSSGLASDGLQHDGWAAETFLTYETQLVMPCS